MNFNSNDGLNKILRRRDQLLESKSQCKDELNLHRQILKTSIYGSINKEEQKLNEEAIKNLFATFTDLETRIEELNEQAHGLGGFMEEDDASHFTRSVRQYKKERLSNLLVAGGDVIVSPKELGKTYFEEKEPSRYGKCIFPFRNFNRKTFWKICSSQFDILDKNKALFTNIKTKDPILALCAALLRDRRRVCKTGHIVHTHMMRNKLKNEMLKTKGDYILRIWRIMEYVIQTKLWMECRNKVEKHIMFGIVINQFPYTHQSYMMEQELADKEFWEAMSKLLDIFEDMCDILPLYVPSSFRYKLTAKKSGNLMRDQLKR